MACHHLDSWQAGHSSTPTHQHHLSSAHYRDNLFFHPSSASCPLRRNSGMLTKKEKCEIFSVDPSHSPDLDMKWKQLVANSCQLQADGSPHHRAPNKLSYDREEATIGSVSNQHRLINDKFSPWLSDLHVFVSLAHFISACSKNSFTFLRACKQGQKTFYFFNK